MINKIQFEILSAIYSDYDDPVCCIDILNIPFCDRPLNPAHTSRVIQDMYESGLVDTYDSFEPYSISYSGDIHLTAKGRQALIDYEMYVIREKQLQEQLDALRLTAESAKVFAENAISDSKAAKKASKRSFTIAIIASIGTAVSAAVAVISLLMQLL